MKLIDVQGRSTLVRSDAVHVGIVVVRLNFRNGSEAVFCIRPEGGRVGWLSGSSGLLKLSLVRDKTQGRGYAMRKFRWITIAVCAILLIATFIGAPRLGSDITGGSLIYSGPPEAKAAVLVSLACSLLSLFLPRNRIAGRVVDFALLALSTIAFFYSVTVSAVAVWQSSYPFSHTCVGLIANGLSALIYLCLGLSIWAVAGLMSRR